jgi:hypothetical protein
VAKHKLQYGSIVHLAHVDDPNGQQAGPHYAVVLNSQESLENGDELQLAVVSTNFQYPLRDGWYELDNIPGKRGGHPKTGMSQACVVKGTWLIFAPQSAATSRGKRAPVKLVNELREWIRQQAIAAARAGQMAQTAQTKRPKSGPGN